MSKKIRPHTSPRQTIRILKKSRIQKKIVSQKGLIARLIVYRSNKFLYAQVIDDLKGHTLANANTQEKAFESTPGSRKNLAAAAALGKLIGQRCIEGKVDRVVFDRNGYDYHGRIKAVADGAREAGLKF